MPRGEVHPPPAGPWVWSGEAGSQGTGAREGLCQALPPADSGDVVPCAAPWTVPGAAVFSFLGSVSSLAIRPGSPGWKAQAAFQEERPEEVVPTALRGELGLFLTQTDGVLPTEPRRLPNARDRF